MMVMLLMMVNAYSACGSCNSGRYVLMSKSGVGNGCRSDSGKNIDGILDVGGASKDVVPMVATTVVVMMC